MRLFLQTTSILVQYLWIRIVPTEVEHLIRLHSKEGESLAHKY